MAEKDTSDYYSAYRVLRVQLIHLLSTTSTGEIGPETRWRLAEAVKRAERVREGKEPFGGPKQGS